MGMGDKPVPYEPRHGRVRDDVTGREYVACAVRSCPHPAVIRRYGTGGVAKVTWYTCRKCHYGEKNKFDSGVRCSYELEDGVQAGEKG